MRIIPILLIPALMVVLSACIVTPTPPPTATFPPEGPPTIEIAPTPTPAPISTPTPQLVQAPDGHSYEQYAAPPLMTIDPQKSYTATLNTSQGNITIKLFASDAPKTVNNFVFLARQGFYDDVIFHRVIKGFMVQTGDPTGTGSGGPGYQFDDEPVNRSYTRGTVAMANSGPNTNGSQFFIVQGTEVDLPPNYTIFGEVTRGMEAVDAIANAPVQASPFGELSSPISPISIETVEIIEGR
jgi:cyclophilin family peptidyl-prolyl cis-trans isomerase